MGNNIWFHISYANEHGLELGQLITRQEIDFNPTVIRLDTKTKAVSLIQCDDFDTEHEPTLGKVVTFKADGQASTSLASNNKLIYHHKWQFVRPDYQGFNYKEAKMRSYVWKSVLGTNKAISSRIGRQLYWNDFLTDHRLHDLNELWLNNAQQFTSKQTSINAKSTPKVFGIGAKLNLFKKGTVNLDLGGGKFESGSEYLRTLDVSNIIYDPYNRDCIDNLKALIEIKKKPVDSVTISNVLNVIQEDSVKLQLIKQAYDALKPNGILIITVYEGNKSGVGAVSKKDCWQENRRLVSYLPIITDVFGSSQITSGSIVCRK
ncbi:hypothetical protein LMH73_006235 [Vibrio splendidus]|nr:hypothetical protein [Vibrio splendidus]MCC4880751.1 hypothetical protein [Vibrio splendidus]